MENSDGNVTGSDAQNVSKIENFLTEAELLELGSLEATVERGLRAFWEIGQALRQIRDKRLYRQDYPTFEEYCITRWEMSRRSAYQLINAAIVVENVRNCAQILPLNEAQARPLTTLEPPQQQEAWTKAVSTAPSGKVTASHVAQVAREYQQPRARSSAKSKDSPPRQLHQSTNNPTQPALPTEQLGDGEQAPGTSTPGATVEGTVATGVEPNQAVTNCRSCWNCCHCSLELLDDPQSFYCYQFGKLSFIEKDGNERGAECELWTYRGEESDRVKKTRLPNEETFTLTLQLPAYLQPLIKDAAKASGLVVVDWAAKVIESAVSRSIYAQSEAKVEGFIEVSVSDAAQYEVSAYSGAADRLSEQIATL